MMIGDEQIRQDIATNRDWEGTFLHRWDAYADRIAAQMTADAAAYAARNPGGRKLHLPATMRTTKYVPLDWDEGEFRMRIAPA